MADEVDHMLEREAIYHEQLLKIRKPEGPKATGFCLTCEDPLPEGRRWCDAVCRDTPQYS